jgi:hypothetical protein
MGFLDELRKQLPEVNLKTGNVGSKSAVKKHPRDNVIQLINNSLSFLNDNKFTVVVKGKTRAPELCYTIKDNGWTDISLSYSRDKLKFDKINTILEIPTNKLKETLVIIKNGVENKEFDEQLEEIKQKRSESQKNARDKKAKK